MIISHKHKFIFLKTRKTAGTSIEISLSRYCGKDDIITPISLDDEKIRAELGIRPQNYNYPFSHYNLKDILRLIVKKKKKIRFWNHVMGTYVKKQIGDKIWNSYYKFCFERNPWDKTVSLFFWRQINKKITFDEFLNSKEFLELPHYNFPIYGDKDSIIIDKVGRYENLHEDLKVITEKVGIEFDGWLPKAKGNFRKEKSHYSKYFNNEQRELIKNKFQKEIDFFKYKFENG